MNDYAVQRNVWRRDDGLLLLDILLFFILRSPVVGIYCLLSITIIGLSIINQLPFINQADLKQFCGFSATFYDSSCMIYNFSRPLSIVRDWNTAYFRDL